MRAGAEDGRTPLDSICAKLDRIGRPRFRLSCREADWFGANDREHLKSISIGGEIKVSASRFPVRGLHPPTPAPFRHRRCGPVHHFGLRTRNRRPAGESAEPTDARACGCGRVRPGRKPGRKRSSWHAKSSSTNTTPSINWQIGAWSSPNPNYWMPLVDFAPSNSSPEMWGTSCSTMEGIPNTLAAMDLRRQSGGPPSCIGDQAVRVARRKPRSPDPPADRRIPCRPASLPRIEDGLPVGRVLALMAGDDGGIVSELRGLSAWLAAHVKTNRGEIIDRDPFGTVFYGDVRAFSHEEKYRVLKYMYRETMKNPWLSSMHRIDSRLGDLANPDMKEIFQEILSDPGGDDARQQFIFFVLQSLVHGQGVGATIRSSHENSQGR